MKSIKTVNVFQMYLLCIVSQWNTWLRYHFVYFLNLSFIVNETNNLSIKWSKGTYNIIKKIVSARKMVGKIARVKIKMVISLVKLLFLFNSEITVFHRYLYNNTLYMRGQSNFYYLSVNSVWNLGLGSNNCGCREITHYRTIYTQTRYCFQFNNTHVLFTLCVFVCA